MKSLNMRAVRLFRAGILFLGAFLVGGWAWGQEVTLTANRNPVFAGQEVQLTLTFKNCNADPKVPKIAGLEYRFGPSTSQRRSWVNGVTTSELGFTYTYQVSASEDVNIPSLAFETNAGVLRTAPFVLRVQRRAAGNGSGGGTGGSGGGTGGGSTGTTGQLGDCALVIKPSQRTAFVGEPISVTFEIYNRYSSLDVRTYNLPDFKGFWKENVQIPSPTWEPRVVDGKRYQVAVVSSVILYPQEAGVLSIDGFDMEGYVRTSFFSGQPIAQKAQPVRIEVKELPRPKPQELLGTFGGLKMQVRTSATEVALNQGVTVEVVFEGAGHLKFIQAPKWSWPSDFEVFDPEVVDRISVQPSGESGKRTFKYLLIPRAPGTFTLPQLQLKYFDFKKGAYVDLVGGGGELTVTREGAMGAGGGVAALGGGGVGQSDVALLNQDVRFQKVEPGPFVRRTLGWGGTVAWGTLWLLGPGIFLAVWTRQRRRAAEQRDGLGTRRRQAGTRVRKALRSAQAQVGNGARFSEALGVGLEEYLCAKLAWQRSRYSQAAVLEALAAHVPDEVAAWRQLLTEVEGARFAPGLAAAPPVLLEQARSLIERTESKWKN
jgi:hypothetical protein